MRIDDNKVVAPLGDDPATVVVDAVAGLTVVVGHPARLELPQDAPASRSISAPTCFNAASVLYAGRVVAQYHKRELPNYQVFDERRYFLSGRDAGSGPLVFEAGGVNPVVYLLYKAEGGLLYGEGEGEICQKA
mgnify:CR=1 FL=1